MSKLYSPKDIVTSGLCIGCGSCVAQTTATNAAMNWDKQGFLKPEGERQWYETKSETFSKTCPFSPVAKNEDYLSAHLFDEPRAFSATIGRFQQAYVGYVAEEEYRLRGSSGGMVSWVASELLKKGLIDGVAHVTPTANPKEEGGFFKYRISRNLDQINEGAQSRYYPIEMSEIIEEIKNVPGRYAVVGIPCFIKAINLLRLQDAVVAERIQYTLGLFCGHMKSARFVESFAWQMNVPAENIVKVDYRFKAPDRPANMYNAKLTLQDGSVVNRDWWHLADGDWGAGFFMNNACNFCDDVVAETADISFGDAWAEPYSKDWRGTNVIVIRSGLIGEMIDKAIEEKKLELATVDENFVTQTQTAGFRQRREGLAYRLTWVNTKVKPCKRVAAQSTNIAVKRKLIYRMRYYITAGSNRFFAIARKWKQPKIYLRFAQLATAIYHGLAYHKGKISEMKKRFLQLSK